MITCLEAIYRALKLTKSVHWSKKADKSMMGSYFVRGSKHNLEAHNYATLDAKFHPKLLKSGLISQNGRSS